MQFNPLDTNHVHDVSKKLLAARLIDGQYVNNVLTDHFPGGDQTDE